MLFLSAVLIMQETSASYIPSQGLFIHPYNNRCWTGLSNSYYLSHRSLAFTCPHPTCLFIVRHVGNQSAVMMEQGVTNPEFQNVAEMLAAAAHLFCYFQTNCLAVHMI